MIDLRKLKAVVFDFAGTLAVSNSQVSGGITIVPGALEVIEKLRSLDIAVVIVSGMQPEPLKMYCKLLELNLPQESLISTESNGRYSHPKSSGYHLHELMLERNWSSDDIIVVGDSDADIAMAKACDVRVVIVLTGYLRRDEALKQGAEWVVSDVGALI